MTTKNTLIVLLSFTALACLVYAFTLRAHADVSNVSPVTIATSTAPTVTSTASLVFATSSCAARTISTSGNSAIMIGFGERVGFVPTGNQGLWQPASTTVTYDAAQYGCGAVRIYSFASQAITVQEAR